MSKKTALRVVLLIQVVLFLAVLALAVAVATGVAVGRPATAPVGGRWLTLRCWPPQERLQSIIGPSRVPLYLAPPHYICFNPSEC